MPRKFCESVTAKNLNNQNVKSGGKQQDIQVDFLNLGIGEDKFAIVGNA
jgi:hypothetical protein